MVGVGVFSLITVQVGATSSRTNETAGLDGFESETVPLALPDPRPSPRPSEPTSGTHGLSELAALEAESRPTVPVESPTVTAMALSTPLEAPPAEPLDESADRVSDSGDEDYSGPGWSTVEIKRGDTLASLFSRQGLSPAIVHKVVHSSPEARSLGRIRPGQSLRLKIDDTGTLICVVHEVSRVSGLRLDRSEDGGYEAESYDRPVEKRVQFATATIDESLYLAAHGAGMSDRLTMNLAEIFGWDVDFALDIRPGDAFSVLYEEEFLDGEKLRDGAILAAEFVNQGTHYEAIRFTDDEGYSEYYTPEGYSMRKAFLKTPVKFGRVSSRFTRKRWHPILKRWRAHKGVDYAAPTGTPIRASGDGRLTYAGRKGGYGKVVFIQHGGKYTTVYAHMSRFAKGMKSGKRVRQGQVIGYVGKTGYATGPHLHYEFRVNGGHRDPLRVKLPKANPIADRHRESFLRVAETRTNQLRTYQTTQVALNN
jgi:murein DD-endopeptidase MepM/ murein hydrolase activator NlpD